jgi:hypothetical protein
MTVVESLTLAAEADKHGEVVAGSVLYAQVLAWIRANPEIALAAIAAPKLETKRPRHYQATRRVCWRCYLRGLCGRAMRSARRSA